MRQRWQGKMHKKLVTKSTKIHNNSAVGKHGAHAEKL